jgi:hypothetical protein
MPQMVLHERRKKENDKARDGPNKKTYEQSRLRERPALPPTDPRSIHVGLSLWSFSTMGPIQFVPDEGRTKKRG